MPTYYKHLREMKDVALSHDKCRKTGKSRFKTLADALDRARKWLADAMIGKHPPGMDTWDGRYLRAYPCKECGGWHLTSAQPTHVVDPRREVRA